MFEEYSVQKAVGWYLTFRPNAFDPTEKNTTVPHFTVSIFSWAKMEAFETCEEICQV